MSITVALRIRQVYFGGKAKARKNLQKRLLLGRAWIGCPSGRNPKESAEGSCCHILLCRVCAPRRPADWPLLYLPPSHRFLRCLSIYFHVIFWFFFFNLMCFFPQCVSFSSCACSLLIHCLIHFGGSPVFLSAVSFISPKFLDTDALDKAAGVGDIPDCLLASPPKPQRPDSRPALL